MIKDFDIRIITEDNFPEMQAILQTSSHDWNSSILISCFGENYKQWAIYFENMILGFVIIKSSANQWELMQVVIDKEYQQQGLATCLLQFVIKEARIKKIEKIQLEVRVSNKSAIRLYHKAGFREVGIRKKYYADKEDALLMDCVL